MSKIVSLILLLCICVVCVQCTSNSFTPRDITAAEQELVKTGNDFGFRLFQEVNKEEGDRNIFISPLSVSMSLGMTLNGADGSTREAMETTLGLSGLTAQEINKSYQTLLTLLRGLDPEVIFQIANSIWYDQIYAGMILEEFSDANRIYFDAEVSGLDFSDPETASEVMSSWVAEHTNGRIEGMVDPTDINPPATVMFLINAMYFKGTWAYRFDEQSTRDDWFILPNGSKKLCKMMTQEGDFQYFANADFQAIDLPYGDGFFSMTIFLPHPEYSIDSLIAKLDQDNWNQWIDSFSKEKVSLELPKFTLEYELRLDEALKALGMGIAFTSAADFSKMCGRCLVYITKVKHKTFVKVDEEGTEAAAATYTRMESGPIRMRVDRPFVFAIRDHHSDTILFIGKVVDPPLE